MSESTIYLVSCVARKRVEPSATRDLYISDWFIKARKLVEATGKPWFVLSAEHGLLSPSHVVAPYERTLNLMPFAARRTWADRVLSQLLAEMPNLDIVTMFAGLRYREFLVPQLVGKGAVVQVPMEGLPIGRQLSWMKLRQQHAN